MTQLCSDKITPIHHNATSLNSSFLLREVLIVEDDPILGRSLAVFLEIEGFKVTWVQKYLTALQMLKHKVFEITILDINLPDGSGYELCHHIKTTQNQNGVIFLTAHSDEESVLTGFNVGGNDYVKKPFSNKELLARVKALLSHSRTLKTQSCYGDLIMHHEKRQVYYNDCSIELNRREFDILKIFLDNPEVVITRDQLLLAIDKDGEIFDRTIDSHVSHLRTKLKKNTDQSLVIASVYGVGYRLEKK